MVLVNISTGELFDKISILQIKKEKIADQSKLKNIVEEIDVLNNAAKDISVDSNVLTELKYVNNCLWDIEDKLRVKESKKEFDEEFIELARQVYYTNDKRASLKRQINTLTNSTIVEEKSYERYD